MKQILATDSARTTLIIRLMVGMVFLSEGLQKFIFPAIRRADRFEKIGIPHSDILGYSVGGFVTVCGLLALLGLLTRLASRPLIIIMLVSLATTKAGMLANEGLWQMLHDSRTDWAMLLGATFLLIKGGGRWSVDRKLTATADP